jgi:hypothetical protein
MPKALRQRGCARIQSSTVWQAYRDPALLWRLAWLGQRTPDVAITGTVVSLTLESDTGDRLIQIID